MAEYDNNTFEDVEPQEPVEPTEPQEPIVPQEPTEPVEPVEPQEPVEPIEPTEPEPTDNWETRARYQQSEADKFKNIATQQQAQFQQYLDLQKPKEVVETAPEKPGTDDPEDMIRYNLEMNQFLLNKMDKREQADTAREQQAEQQRTAIAQRDYSISQLTTATKSPEKSKKILDFFVDTRNLEDPAMYNVMYDAAMDYRNHKTSTGKPGLKTPPPPIGGGEEVETGKETPDDKFNEQLRQEDNYRL